MKKRIILNFLAVRELDLFPTEVRARFFDLFKILEKEGKLEMPFAKKIGQNLFEIRIKHHGQWRAIYAYFMNNEIVILSAFVKKTNKTPKKEIDKSIKRLKKYK